MKFLDKYPNAKYLEVFEDGMMKGKELRSCWHCKTDCNWIDIDFQAHLCSEECQRAKWKEFCEADERSNDEKDDDKIGPV